MHGPGKVLWGFELAFHEDLVDDHLRRDICQFASLPSFHLFSHGFKVPLHPVDTH